MNILKQSTAATIKLGPFIDDTDGKTAETGLTISQADIRLSKNGGDFAQKNNATGATHDEFGYYDIPLNTTDTGTLGRLRVAVSESGALPVWQDFLVVTANVYDTLCSTDTFDVNVATIAPDAITALATGVWTDTDGYGADEKGFLLQTFHDDLVNGGRLDLLIDSIIAHLVGIKGSGWTDETMVALMTAIEAIPTAPLLASGYTAPDNAGIAAIKAKTDNLPADPADDSDIDAAIAAVKSVVDDILVDTGTTLDALVKDIPTNAELATALGTAGDAVLAAVAAAKAVIDNIHDTDLPAVKAETALIVEDTGTTLPATLATLAGYTDGIAGDVWSYAKRTLTHPSVSAEEPEDSNTLILYRDADIAIELTDLTIPAGAKKYIFTIKDNLDSGDDQAVLQASYAIDGSEVETNTLVYINSAAAPVLTNPVTFTLTDTNITIDLTAEAAALLPRYERGYLNWDLKLVTDAAVTIVLQGLAQIIGTSTRAIE